MSATKHYLDIEKIKFDWRAVAYAPTGEYDKFGRPIKKHIQLTIISTFICHR